MNYDKKYTQYAEDVLNDEIIACNYIKMACRRYLSFLEREDIEFKPDKVDRVINFVSKLRHTTGGHNGKRFILEPWQVWIVCNIYGFYYKGSNERVTKNVYIEVARKNGKTTFAAALCLYALIADGENNSEVELIANSAKQAGICFSMCQNFVQGIDSKNKAKRHFKQYRDKIKFDATKSFLQVLSSDGNSNDGWNSYFFVADEAHSYTADAPMFNVMKSSQGMRDNPIALIITTAGFNLFGFCYQQRTTNIEILTGAKTDDSQFTAIYTLDDGDRWQDENCWVKSNPNLGVTVKKQYLKEQVQQATNNTTLEVGTRTKNFNQWLASSDIWLSNDLLLKYTESFDLSRFKNETAYIGIDLAAVSDLTAVCALIQNNGKYYFKTWYFLPSATLEESANADKYKQWKREGHLIVTEGNVTDYDYILDTIKRINKDVIIQQIGYDKWNATQFAINAEAEGLPMEEYGQNIYNFNRPTRDFERILKGGKVIIDNNPITRFCFANVVLKEDYNQNCKPTKTSNDNKIDGVIAMLTALGLVLQTPMYDNSIE